MSAWDITGAVIWTFLALCFWAATRPKPGTAFSAVEFWCAIFAICFSAAAIFCFARLCGAHA